eukprot:scaffold15318_cov125-Isochrysis_galbana.AAC.2
MQEVLQRHQLLGAMTTSAPHNPQQNGSAERMWRTLLEPSIAKLIRAKLPASFWWYAMSDTAEVDALIPLKGTRAGKGTYIYTSCSEGGGPLRGGLPTPLSGT